MSDWNSELYLKFEKQRTAPAIDLANRVRQYHPKKNRGHRLRPYLEALDVLDAKVFEKEIIERVVQTYPAMKNGEVILRFRRFFFVAVK